MTYASNRFFKVWAYIISHSILFVRSNKFENELDEVKNDFTIDIEFDSVAYFELPCKLYGASICKIDQGIPDRVASFLQSDLKVFEITSAEQRFYDVAARCIIGKSKMEFDEHRSINLDLKYDDILFSA